MVSNIILEEKCVKLSRASNNNRQPAFDRFEWPVSLPMDEWWMPREALSVYGTSIYQGLTEDFLKELSRRELINQFSLSIHNERVLINEVLIQVAKGNLPEAANDYLHHFVEEENQHMWYFNKFCRRYFGKIYGMKAVTLSQELSGDLQQFMVFARIFIFEEFGDFFNRRIAECEYVDSFVRKINRAHVEEEARHISFGKAILDELFENIKKNSTEEQRKLLSSMVENYLKIMVESIYNASVYREVGISNPIDFRAQALLENTISGGHDNIMRRPQMFFRNIGLLK